MLETVLLLAALVLFGIIFCIIATYYSIVFLHYIVERKCGLHICLWCKSREMCDWPKRYK